ncbi:LysR family transcriptional regulator [Paenibacillus sp. N1-5-1-14]|uniref:LysR family transcriptional regulator n=1 Tax=Paenibacillus radicibacter TaxID=2972488 RepID=UPI002159AD20|nr:LysR family transcriptional regulator [Paenibacillus radicibacter]MCR8643897.1 LysR family transcriptional regulator [Paenibacillus radicibacter]
MELRQLLYFVKVARKQHVTQASEELRVAQSAVSRQIHMLEEELGVTLFVQKGRNVQLTSVGRLFLSRIEGIMTDLEKAVNEIQEFLDPDAGEIRIGFPHSVVLTLLPKVIASFRKDHPNVKFLLKQGTYNSLIKDVSKGEIDLAFISPFPESHEHVTGEILLTEELYAILPEGHMLAEYNGIQLSQLKDEPFVMFSESYSLRSIVMDACLKSGFTPKIEFEAEETDTIRGLVAAGMGVSLLPELALIEYGTLKPVKVRVIEPKVTRTVGLIRRRDEKLPLIAEVFRRFLLEYFNRK